MPLSPAIGVAPETGPPHFVLAVEVFNPSHFLGVGDLLEEQQILFLPTPLVPERVS